MTVDQQSIDYIKERIKGIATHGIRQTLLDVQDELNLLSHLLGAGTEASVAEIHARASVTFNNLISRSKKSNNNGTFVNLTELDDKYIQLLENYTKYVIEQQTHISKIEQEKDRLKILLKCKDSHTT